MNVLSDVYSIFKELNGVPRPSHHEERAADWLCAFARLYNLEYKRDNNNCVVIKKKASKGYEKEPVLILMAHIDMVCVADEGVDFDPLSSPIQSYNEDGWMKAKGTSLGADNGIGLSIALAILKNDNLEHPALEALFTTNEEDGMSGAEGLSNDFIEGRRVLNLDSEDYNTITLGAAGAYIQFTYLPYLMQTAPEKHSFLKISLQGGLGGHSGVEINKGRCNTNALICQICSRVNEKQPIYISSLNGGDANASIPSWAEATIAVPTSGMGEVMNLLAEIKSDVNQKYAVSDPGLQISFEEVNALNRVVAKEDGYALFTAIANLPIDVIEYLPNSTTPLSSNNIGVIKMEDDRFFISTHTRSFVDDTMIQIGKEIKTIFQKYSPKFETQVIMSAPSWQENKDSEYVNMISNTFERVLGFTPEKVEMHFVLEAGYYVKKYPCIQIACIGPRIVSPHSTKEKVEISTIDNIVKVVIEILKNKTNE